MKKFVFLLFLTVAAIGLFAQEEEAYPHFNLHDLYIGANMTHQEINNAKLTFFTAPYLYFSSFISDGCLDLSPKNINNAKLDCLTVPYLYHEIRYAFNSKTILSTKTNLYLVTRDLDRDYYLWGEQVKMYWEDKTKLFFDTTPELKYNSKDIFYASLEIPTYIDKDFSTVTIKANLMLSTWKDYLPGLSPWASYEKGCELRFTYGQNVYEKFFDQEPANKDNYLGISAFYALFNDKDMMVKPYASLKRHVNREYSQNVETSAGILTAYDLNNMITFVAEGCINSFFVEGASAFATIHVLNTYLKAGFYPAESLSLFCGFTYDKIISHGFVDPTYGLMLNLEYYFPLK